VTSSGLSLEPLWALPSVAAYAAGVRVGTLRQWAARGLVTRSPDGRYDLRSVLARVDSRQLGKARGAVLAAHVRHQRWLLEAPSQETRT
jgi:hypothetical protein